MIVAEVGGRGTVLVDQAVACVRTAVTNVRTGGKLVIFGVN